MEQIELFYTVGKKCDNDSNNKRREEILEGILKVPEEYLNDAQYGEKWREVQNGWRDVLRGLCSDVFDSMNILKMAGRGNNYDYCVNYYNSEQIVNKRCIEFKYNSSSLDKIPQFLQLYENCGFIEKSYAEFYYENYLWSHIEHIPGLEILDKELYLKLVRGTKYNCNPFFSRLKDAELDKPSKSVINKVVNKSIGDYLTRYAKEIDLEVLQKRLSASQKEKVFVMWKSGKFTTDTISIGSKLEYKGVKNKNTIVVDDIEQKQEYHLLLRWKNHKGVLNPAWQISLCKGLTLAKKLVK